MFTMTTDTNSLD